MDIKTFKNAAIFDHITEIIYASSRVFKVIVEVINK